MTYLGTYLELLHEFFRRKMNIEIFLGIENSSKIHFFSRFGIIST